MSGEKGGEGAGGAPGGTRNQIRNGQQASTRRGDAASESNRQVK